MMTRPSLLLIALLASSFSAAACSAEVTPSTDPPSTPAPAPSTPPEGSAPTPPSPSPSSPPSKEDPKTPATLAIDSAAYGNTQSGSSSFAYAITFVIDNTSTEDVVSLDAMTFDFGAGKKVALNQSACQGTFAIAAGAKKNVSVRVVVSSSGDVQPAGFSILCASSQSFGAGDGTAPPTASFSGPIGISASGKTKSGAFSAAGTATRTP